MDDRPLPPADPLSPAEACAAFAADSPADETWRARAGPLLPGDLVPAAARRQWVEAARGRSPADPGGMPWQLHDHGHTRRSLAAAVRRAYGVAAGLGLDPAPDPDGAEAFSFVTAGDHGHPPREHWIGQVRVRSAIDLHAGEGVPDAASIARRLAAACAGVDPAPAAAVERRVFAACHPLPADEALTDAGDAWTAARLDRDYRLGASATRAVALTDLRLPGPTCLYDGPDREAAIESVREHLVWDRRCIEATEAENLAAGDPYQSIVFHGHPPPSPGQDAGTGPAGPPAGLSM